MLRRRTKMMPTWMQHRRPRRMWQRIFTVPGSRKNSPASRSAPSLPRLQLSSSTRCGILPPSGTVRGVHAVRPRRRGGRDACSPPPPLPQPPAPNPGTKRALGSETSALPLSFALRVRAAPTAGCIGRYPYPYPYPYPPPPMAGHHPSTLASRRLSRRRAGGPGSRSTSRSLRFGKRPHHVAISSAPTALSRHAPRCACLAPAARQVLPGP